MRTYLFIRGTVFAASLTLIPWVPVLLTQAADQPRGAGIPEVMAGQPAPQHDVLTSEVPPAQTIWVDEIRNSLDSYRRNYPTSFRMPANRAYGINEDNAGELSNFAQMVTSIREYGISVPRSGSDQYGSDILSSGSSQ
jgi:hypothetical protein